MTKKKRKEPADEIDQLHAFALALGDEDDSAKGGARADYGAWAKQIRSKIAAANERAELAAFPLEPIRPKDEALEIMAGLMALAKARLGEGAVSVHFHKFESATVEDLAELIRELRYLLAKHEIEP
jgi:hypothetical protein